MGVHILHAVYHLTYDGHRVGHTQVLKLRQADLDGRAGPVQFEVVLALS
jgi:hypothetical protein